AVSVYVTAAMDEQRVRFGFVPLLHTLLMGVNGAFLTGDMFNLYVWFEVMLIASFVLIVLGGEKAQFAGAVKYVTVNLLASILFLIGAGILYGKTGTLNFADLASKLATDPDSTMVNTTAMLFITAFGIKAAIFPFFFWLPDSYHVPPVAVTALFAGLLTKVGVYAFLRTFTLIFVHDTAFTQPLFSVLAALTMILGVLGAVAQGEMKRLLSFHIVSQIGYAMMGLAIFTVLALSGAIYFTLHVAIVKVALFLVAGYISRLRGSTVLVELGGMLRDTRTVSVLFLVAALSLAGLPPFSGFFAKYSLVKAGLLAEDYGIVSVALLVSMLTLFSMTKIWGQVFWKASAEAVSPKTGAAPAAPSRWTTAAYLLPTAFLVAVSVTMGLAAEPVFEMTTRAAEQLLQPGGYIQAVLGGRP
ncbi:MAG: proton-conducting transporter membrane subunit, partial [Bacteroidota bacterium]|nr:proton-conducting transporter membrane subunit [Bacteroidota bacterium]